MENKPHVKGQCPVMGGFWERFVAVSLDSLILIISMMIFAQVLFIVFPGPGSKNIVNVLRQLFSFGISMSYYIYFYTKDGQTLGKKLMKLKVVNTSDLKYMSAGKVLLREIVGKFLSGIFLYFGFFGIL